MRVYLFLYGIVYANFDINCKDNPSIQCATVDCSQTIKRALCPETCNLCSKINEMTCRDNGNFCDVMSCTHASAKVMCAKSCNLCGATGATGISATSAPTVSTQIDCVDKNKNCHTNLCGHTFGQHQCPATCHPKCQIKTTRAPYIRTTRPPRPTKPPRTPKPPKIAKNILENSPCQDNPMYGQMCGSALMKCDKTMAKMFCMRSCGLCASIDQMFVCKDNRPDLCQMINCDNYLAGQYCAKSCNKCLKPHHMRQAAKATAKPTTTTRKTKTTRRTTTRKMKKTTTTKKPTTISLIAECKDDPSYATICRDPSLDCTNILVTTVCRKSCNVCEGQQRQVAFTTTTAVPTTQRTLIPRTKVKCTSQDLSDLSCEHECQVESGKAVCVCWKGFTFKGSNCVEDKETDYCKTKPSNGCKLTVDSIQKLHIEIYNSAIPERACYGTPLSQTQIASPMSCINRLGTSDVTVRIIRSDSPDLIKTTHAAKVTRALFQSNLALITITGLMKRDEDDQCFNENEPNPETKCYAVGFGTSRNAVFSKPALIEVQFSGSKKCSDLSSEMCATNSQGRLSDLDDGSTVVCQFCSSCGLYRFGMIMNVSQDLATVRTLKSITDEFDITVSATECENQLTKQITTVMTTTTITTRRLTTTTRRSTTTSKTTSTVKTRVSNFDSQEKCCFIAKISSTSKDTQFIRLDEHKNNSPVYHDSELNLYLWFAEYKDSFIWIVTPTVGVRKNAVFIGNSAASCPDGVNEWLVWRNQKWTGHVTTFECLLQTNPDQHWLKWSAWSPCSFKKCDGTETRTRVRYCTGKECAGDSEETEICPTTECEKLKNACCHEIESDFEVNGKRAKFHFDRILDDKIVYREKDYHDIFLYNVGDHWEIGKGLLQKTIYHKSQTFHAECPSRTGLQWLTHNDTIVDGGIKCSTVSKGWTQWSSCLEQCQSGKRETTRKRTCQEVKQNDNNYVKCGEDLVERQLCECDDFAKLIKMDQECCSTFELKFRQAAFNGIYYKYLDEEGKLHYRNKNDYYLFWSEEYFSWVVTPNEMNEKNAMLRLHGEQKCFLEGHQSKRKRRSSLYISNQFKDSVWKSFNLEQLRWTDLDENDISLACI